MAANHITNDNIRSNLQLAWDNYYCILEILSCQKKLFDIYAEEFREFSPSEMFQLTHGYKILHESIIKSISNPNELLKLNSKYAFGTYQFTVGENLQIFNDEYLISSTRKQKNERVFKSEIWNQNPYYNILKNTYLITEKYFLEWLVNLDCDEPTKEQIRFYLDIFLSSIIPTNSLLTNPKVIERINQTGGTNLLTGYKYFLQDLIYKDGQLSITLTDQSAFQVGTNLACTPGRIIMQNDLIQLIEYTPQTSKVNAKPILFVPPCINKYYILDLSQHNSLVRWLVEQGYVVYMISWVNPESDLANKTYEEYILEGPVAALDFITDSGVYKQVNMVGYCIGGTFLATALAYLRKKNDSRINSASFFMTLLDFFDIGELGAFIDEKQLSSICSVMEHKGYLDGRILNLVFSLIRPYELVWPHFINNYLLGEKTKPVDILYWNSDSTNLPSAMYEYYLTEMCLRNKLKDKNAIVIDGTPIDLGEIDMPCFFLSSEADHITPWCSVYRGAQLVTGEVDFVLSKSGHVRAVVNPPPETKYGYFNFQVDDNELPKDHNKWLKNAELHDTSWWIRWLQWLNDNNADQIDRTELPTFKMLEPAPGSYVKKRI